MLNEREEKKERENCTPMRLLYNVNGGMIKTASPLFSTERKEWNENQTDPYQSSWSQK